MKTVNLPIEKRTTNKIIVREKNGRIRVQTKNDEPSKTDQSFAQECDINYITQHLFKTGHNIHPNTAPFIYGDVSEIPKNLHEAHMLVEESNRLFMELPATARDKFNHSPEKMFQWLQNPQNHPEAVKLGLMQQKQAPQQNDKLNDEKPPEPQKAPKAPKTPASDT